MPSQLRLDLGEPDETPSSEPVAEKPARKKRSRKKATAGAEPQERPPEVKSEDVAGGSVTNTNATTQNPSSESNRMTADGSAAVPQGVSPSRAFLYARGAPAQLPETSAPPADRGVPAPSAVALAEARPLKVAEVTARIKTLLEGDAVLCRVTVEGEISNLNRAGSGHVYFTLKDESSTLRATIWAAQARRIRAAFQNG
ncbi:MAG TPA: exodeoxyribonuclease VII large subunit, partial [Candidatus Ozemobacteraceae bacterium]|nr:exodeoxyribonuclease VII large subunit [Candidatus Ozemobacteraceae bacterium]